MERILAYGPPGCGKTFQLLQIAKWLQPTGAQFWVLDTDNSYPKSLGEFPGLTNVHATFAYDWAEYSKWLKTTMPQIKPDRDWIVVDRIDKGWQRVQDFMTEEVYNMSLEERLLERRKEQVAKGKEKAMVASIGPQVDWQVINALWRGWAMSLFYRTRANVYVTTAAEAVRGEDAQELRDIYGPLGAKPTGQKDIPYEVDTSLFLTVRFNGEEAERKVVTAKDRGGRRYMNEELISLPRQYLQGIAGWSLKKD